MSWIFISSIGWVVFFFMFRTEKDLDPDANDTTVTDTAEVDETPAPPQFSPDPEAVHEPDSPQTMPRSDE